MSRHLLTAALAGLALSACGGASVDSALTDACTSALEVLKIDDRDTVDVPTEEVKSACACTTGKLGAMSDEDKTVMSTNLAKITAESVNSNSGPEDIMSPEAMTLLPQFVRELSSCDERFK